MRDFLDLFEFSLEQSRKDLMVCAYPFIHPTLGESIFLHYLYACAVNVKKWQSKDSAESRCCTIFAFTFHRFIAQRWCKKIDSPIATSIYTKRKSASPFPSFFVFISWMQSLPILHEEGYGQWPLQKNDRNIFLQCSCACIFGVCKCMLLVLLSLSWWYWV